MARRLGWALGLVVLLLLGSWGLYALTLGGVEPAPSPVRTPVQQVARPTPAGSASAPAAAAEPTGLRVLELEGRVERRSPGGQWEAVRSGDSLRPDDALRTQAASRVALALGESTRVEVSARSEFTVAQLSRSLSRVRLDEGRLSAVVRPGGGLVRVESKVADGAVAETAQGSFAVLASGQGQLTVAATEGQVQLRSPAGAVVIGAGEQSITRLGRPPTVPSAIPHSLFLKVGKPPSLQREHQLLVSGRTTPGAVVSVNGVRVEPGQGGEFSTWLTLPNGRNAVRVEAEDASGTLRRRTLPVTIKSRVKEVRAKVTWGGGRLVR